MTDATWTWTRVGPREWQVSIDTRPQWQRDLTDDEVREMEARRWRARQHGP